MNKIKEKWVAFGGSIFTDAVFFVKTENKSKVTHARSAIAFNLAPEVAEHIVKLHNASLD
jgi:hypothetical protein